MYKFSYHAIAPFASHALSILVFCFLIAKNPRSKLHITLGLFCLSASLWQLATGMMFVSKTDELALFWDRVVYVGVNLQWVLHFHFTILLLKADSQRKWLVAAYALAALFGLAIPTDYLVHDIYRYDWGCHSIAGPLHHPFVLVSTGFYLKCLHLIYQRFRQTTNEVEKNQHKYYMAGFTIFVSASLAYLPAYEIPLYPFAYWFESVYCLTLVYIIVKHRMLDIETVVHKTLLWLVTSAATFVPLAIAVYFLHSLLTGLKPLAFVAAAIALLGASIGLYSLLQPRIDHLFQRKKYGYREALDRFMEVAITLNDRERLAKATRDTIGSTIYASRVRCFWAKENVFSEAEATSGQGLTLTPAEGVIRHLIRTRELVERDLLLHDPSYENVKQPLALLFEQTNAVILLPILHEDTLHGLVTLERKRNLGHYTDLDRRFLREIFIGMSVAVINALMFETERELLDKEREARLTQEELVRIKDEMNRELEKKVASRTEELSTAMQNLNAANQALVAAKDALWGEMQLAKKIQTLLLPQTPHIPGYDIAAYMNPAAEVGGDYYDVITTTQGDWLIIGDVSGHGVSAGLVMMMVQTAIHTALEQNAEIRPKRLLAILNDVLARNVQRMNESKHVTMTAMRHCDNGAFIFAGLHQDILLYRAESERVEVIPTEGVWLGLVSPVDQLLTDASLEMRIGDVMLLFTDGITEAVQRCSASGESKIRPEMFGQERLGSLLTHRRGDSLQNVKDRIVSALKDFYCNDDVTFLLVQRTC
jgi:serine phosphatase RsbU (regulator of sigma subunit)